MTERAHPFLDRLRSNRSDASGTTLAHVHPRLRWKQQEIGQALGVDDPTELGAALEDIATLLARCLLHLRNQLASRREVGTWQARKLRATHGPAKPDRQARQTSPHANSASVWQRSGASTPAVARRVRTRQYWVWRRARIGGSCNLSSTPCRGLCCASRTVAGSTSTTSSARAPSISTRLGGRARSTSAAV